MTTSTTTVEPFSYRLRIGTLDTGYKSRAVVCVDVEWDGHRLSMTGDAKRPRAADIDQGGQMKDTIAAMPEADLDVAPAVRDEIVRLWRRWHLNDMRAGCEHQRAEGWTLCRGHYTQPEPDLARAFGDLACDGIALVRGGGRHYYCTDEMLPAGASERCEGNVHATREPCPVCGYGYGTAWLHEEVPTRELQLLLSFAPHTREGDDGNA